MDKLLELKDITKSYGTKVVTKVLHGINLSVEKGELTSIIGQSGSGKSTLLNIIGALDRPSQGHVYFNNININNLNDDRLAKFRNENIGFIFQFHHLLPELNVLENVLMPSWIQYGKMPDSKTVNRAKELIDIVGISNRIKNKPNELSGGQRQRVAIARALLNNPSLVLADEPTGNLDSDSTEKIFNLIKSINKEFNTSFIIVTHDMHIASKSNRVIEIKDGHIVSDIYNTGKTELESFQNFAPNNCLFCGKKISQENIV